MRMNNNIKALISLAILILALLVFLPLQPAVAGDIPTAVDGRILTRDKTGDTSDWVELARYNGYSLIVRKTVLPLGQVVFDNRNIDAYQISDVRNMVNNWFNRTLNSNAKLRDYTVKSNPLQEIGYFAVISNGFCLPTDTALKTGDDVAFLLSFGEAARYCSKQYATSTTSWVKSPDLAIKNFNKLDYPQGAELYMRDFWWLRSGGHNAGSTKSASSVGTHATQTMGSTVYASSSQAAYPYVRPALWVKSSIFLDGHTITGKLYPMAIDNLGVGQDFLDMHEVTVELRQTFLTPAPAALSTKAVLVNDDCLGSFTINNVPDGSYILYIKRAGYLTRAMKVTVKKDDPEIIELKSPDPAEKGIFNLWGGDYNDDLVIDTKDLMVVLALWGENVSYFDPYYEAACDFNSDGIIDIKDMMIVQELAGKTVWDYPGADDIDFFI